MKKNAPKAKRWLRWLGGCAVALIVAVCGFWYWINIPPRVKIPPPVMLIAGLVSNAVQAISLREM